MNSGSPWYRLVVWTFALCLLISGCAQLVPVAQDPGDDDGIGGTGVLAERNPDDGIGGTGYGDDDGIGGTGLWASAVRSGDVALFGIANPVGATLQVNGHGVIVPPGLMAKLGDEHIPFSELKQGQIVAVKAGLIEGVISAKLIEIIPSVIGPISHVSSDGSRLEVFGQSVLINAVTPMLDRHGGPRSTAFKPGDVVRVSGLQRVDGIIEASLIEATPDQQSFSVSGWASRVEVGGYRIGELDLLAAERQLPGIESARVRVVGTIVDGNPEVSSVNIAPPMPFADSVDYWSIQGFAVRATNQQGVEFSSYQRALEFEPEVASRAAIGLVQQRVIMEIKRGSSETPTVNRILPSTPPGSGTELFIPHYTPSVPGMAGDYQRIRLPIEKIEPVLPRPNVRPGVDAMPTGAVPPPRPPKIAPRIRQPLPPATQRPVDVQIMPPAVDGAIGRGP